MEELIYSKADPKDSGKELPDMQLPDMPEVSFKEFAESLKENITIRKIPGRKEKQKRFAEAVEALSEEYEYDAQIWRSENGITAEISLDAAQPTSGKLSRLIGMADSFGISLGERNRDVTISLKCSTFYVCYKGRIILPELFAE